MIGAYIIESPNGFEPQSFCQKQTLCPSHTQRDHMYFCIFILTLQASHVNMFLIFFPYIAFGVQP
jgi:hypothetical protein